MLKNRFALLLLTILSFSWLISCEESTINPFEDEKGIYSVYGALSMDRSINYIRVRKLDTPLFADSTLKIDGIVTFTDLETGISNVLQDTVVNFSGNFTQNFILDQVLELNRTYELKVERSDGAAVRSSFTTPQQTDVDIKINFPELQCETPITFTYKNVRDPELIQMEVGILHNGNLNWAPMQIVGRLTHKPNADEMTVVMSPRNLMVEVFPPIIPDIPNFNTYLLFPTVSCAAVENRKFHIRYTHFGAEWNEGKPRMGQIDFESGIIDNGLGFIGSYRTGEFSFSLGDSDEDLAEI
jgi:hypothetical protein